MASRGVSATAEIMADAAASVEKKFSKGVPTVEVGCQKCLPCHRPCLSRVNGRAVRTAGDVAGNRSAVMEVGLVL